MQPAKESFSRSHQALLRPSAKFSRQVAYSVSTLVFVFTSVSITCSRTSRFDAYPKQIVRDLCGTALYFFEYDAMRYLLGRNRSGEQGPTPAWLPIPVSLVPFVCGSIAGVSSWAFIYPLDVYVPRYQVTHGTDWLLL